ncbi:MAG: TolC family protein [Sulfurovum sp.]|nr:TolC family protein [Sulfurovum sp.]
MKKPLILYSLLFASFVYADDLGDILSDNKSLLFEYQMQSNALESQKLSQSWINPVVVSYRKSYSTQFKDRSDIRDNYSVQIDQPIFRSGGIYYGIRYADVLGRANAIEIRLQKRQMIGDAVSILFNLSKNTLEQKKMKYLIKNDEIDIHQKRDSYDSGILDSSFLNQAILKKSQDEASLLELELRVLEMKQRFSLLSDKNPSKLTLPKLKLLPQDVYRSENLALQKDRLRAEQADYNTHVTMAKYLPTVSVTGQYINGDLNPLFLNPNLKESYYNYGISISMALDIDTLNDIELSKIEKLKTAVQVLDTKDQIEEEYVWIDNSLKILDKKILLAQKDAKIYQNLLILTQNLVEAGEKTSLDTDIMQNSITIRKLDQKIYKIDKQIQLLKLYIRVENVL